MSRLRLIQLVVHPTVVEDDGENLTPVQVAPFVVPATDLDDFPQKFRDQLAEEEARLGADPLDG